MVHNGADAVGVGAAEINQQIRRVSMDIGRKSRDDAEGASDVKLDFVMSHGLSTPEANQLLKKWGRNELVEKVTPTWLVIFRLVIYIAHWDLWLYL
jgi:hypothetical protein